MAHKKSQTQLVLEYMQANGGITTKQAYEDLGITRLSARIFELRTEHNIPVNDEFIKVQRRNGEQADVKRYFLPKKHKQLSFI